MYSDRDLPRGRGCPIRISTDQSLFAAPHGFSQRTTSFIASWCQGIHRMPLSCTWSRKARSAFSRQLSVVRLKTAMPKPTRPLTMHRSQSLHDRYQSPTFSSQSQAPPQSGRLSENCKLITDNCLRAAEHDTAIGRISPPVRRDRDARPERTRT